MATDQEIRDAGFKYIPQQQYLQNPFELPTTPEEEPVINQGIVNTNAFNYGRGNDFSVYNPDPNSIVNKIYRPNYDYRQDREINSKTFNPQPYGTGVQRAQSQYNLARNNITASGPMTPERQAEVLRTRNNIIQDNRQNYGAEGQFVDQYDPRYSSVTEAQKFMDNFPEYYTKPEPTGAQKFLQFAGSFVPGAGAAGLISPYLPVNRRRIMENELGGKGIMVNNIGQIVQGQGAYDTAANVMAGYNPVKMTAETFDKRLAKIAKTMGKKGYEGDLQKRYDAIVEARQNFLDAQDESDDIYKFEKERKKKKRDNSIIGRFFKQKKQQKEDDRIAKEKADAATAAAQNATYYTPTGTSGGGAGQGIDISGAGTVRSSDNNFQGDSGPTNQQESTYGYSTDFGFARGGRAGYFFGGRVNFKHGGLASIL